MNRITRRVFMKKSAAAGIVAGMPFSRVLGAHEDVRVAVIGLHNQGANHVNWFRKIPGVRVVGLCDADQTVLDREKSKFQKRSESVKTFRDVRNLLDDKDIDAVIIAAPDHWHALMTVWACQAGKDVYVEKPVCHELWEGRQMVKAARKYNRIVQAGTQRRSDAGLQEAIKYIQAGNLGAIRLARGLCYVRRGSIGKVDGPQPVPGGVDYDLWCGPAPKGPLMRNRLHYDWHWVWPNGTGELGNNGIHFMDVCRWVIGAEKIAPRVISIGGRFGYVDDGETPNTQLVYLDYKPSPILYEVRGLPRKTGDPAMDDYRGIRIDVVIHCEGGYLAGGWVYDNQGKKIRQFPRDGGGGHHANFIKAVRSRKRSDLNADILEGHLSTALCHMGNISYRTGKVYNSHALLDSIRKNDDLVDAFERMEQHLRANNVDFHVTPQVAGPWLEMDADRERFTGEFSEQANALLTRNYRKPYVLPQSV